MENQTQALTVVNSQMPLSAVIAKSANSMDAIDRLGEWFAKSGLFGADRVEQGKIMALTCMTEGLTPVEFSRTYDVVQGKLRKKSMAAFAEFRKRGGSVKWINPGEDGKTAVADFTFEGQTVTLSFTIEQARLAGLVKRDSGWEKNPANMLRARLISNALGMLAPEIFAGEYDDSDAPPAPQMNLAPEPQAEPKAAKVTTVETVVEPREKPPIKNFGDVAKAIAEDREAKAAIKQPSAPPAPRPNPSATTSVPGTHTHTPMTTETATQLATVLRTPDEIMRAVQFFIGQKWLAEGQTIEDLSDAAAKKVIGNAESFRKKVLGVA